MEDSTTSAYYLYDITVHIEENQVNKYLRQPGPGRLISEVICNLQKANIAAVTLDLSMI